jgi:hypothetical protein
MPTDNGSQWDMTGQAGPNLPKAVGEVSCAVALMYLHVLPAIYSVCPLPFACSWDVAQTAGANGQRGWEFTGFEYSPCRRMTINAVSALQRLHGAYNNVSLDVLTNADISSPGS